MVIAGQFAGVLHFTKEKIVCDSRELSPELVFARDASDFDDENNFEILIVCETSRWCDVQTEDVTLLIRE